ncbi:MFS transporter [Plantactinospora solaniradicis]|uniref:MFS transporter n=1 Tax=Plantactinospora solaniradicis TaxID=1723736 RepID=A0ABW1KNQ7_9ACTN
MGLVTRLGSGPAVRRSQQVTLALCWAVLVVEGYDIVVYGAAVPMLLRVDAWELGEREIGLLGSAALVGMLFGAIVASLFADRLGRRPVLVSGVVVFSFGMLVCAAAPTPVVFGGGRLVVGLGTGVLLPTAAAFVAEFAPPGRRNLYQGVVFGGIGVGGALSAVSAIALAGSGFRAMFLVGVLPVVVLVPVLLRWLPESGEFLVARERAAGQPSIPAGSWPLLLSRDYASRTLLFWTATFLSLLVLFGSYTWLPLLMNRAGYDLGSSLRFLLALNFGVVAGSLMSSRLADRFGGRRVIFGSFVAASAAFALLAQAPPMLAGYALVAVVGVGAVNAQFLVNAYVAASYPTMHRGTAVGAALGIGRLGGVLGPVYGGWLLAERFPVAAGFYGFALPALLAAVVVAAFPGIPGSGIQQSAGVRGGRVRMQDSPGPA